MIPGAGAYGRTETTFNDCVSERVLGFESDGRSTEPERRVMHPSQSDWMFKDVKAIIPPGPEGNGPSIEPSNRHQCGYFVRPSIELPSTTDLSGHILRPSKHSMICIAGDILHRPAFGEGLHVVSQE